MNNPKNRSPWTPEQKLQALKEAVTAAIGLLLVLFTLFVAYRAFGFAGTAEMADAKDILQVTIGLAGVVLGYYFGRAPADARSTQALEQANAATAHAERVNNKGQELADHIDKMLIADALPQSAPNGGSQMVQELHQLREDLREMTNTTRSR